MTDPVPSPVLVVTGAGGMGLAVARRVGSGTTIVLADLHDDVLAPAVASLNDDGFVAVGVATDVSSKPSVAALAEAAAARGPITAVVHTAGLSPVQASTEAVLHVDLLGTALVLDAFGAVIAPGGAGVFIASMAALMSPIDRELEVKLATTPTDELLDLPELAPDALGHPAIAYVMSKRANQLRVRSASRTWGARGARVNSISPGVIATAMGNAELAGESGETMRAMVAGSGTGRLGTADDIAAATAFLLSRDASFITGTDLLVDGGVVGSLIGPQG